MAVGEDMRGRGYGSRILQGLEVEAARRGAKKVVLNARDSVTEFYASTVTRLLVKPKRFSA
jgi:N-acetylglutamate synthase-like GNAT family acetyltransferase